MKDRETTGIDRLLMELHKNEDEEIHEQSNIIITSYKTDVPEKIVKRKE